MSLSRALCIYDPSRVLNGSRESPPIFHTKSSCQPFIKLYYSSTSIPAFHRVHSINFHPEKQPLERFLVGYFIQPSNITQHFRGCNTCCSKRHQVLQAGGNWNIGLTLLPQEIKSNKLQQDSTSRGKKG